MRRRKMATAHGTNRGTRAALPPRDTLIHEDATMTPQTFTFASSPFWPIAIGFFGLGTGYFIWDGQALFGYPKTSPEVDRTMGMWGFWMPGFCPIRRRRLEQPAFA
jgi:hypothetical protein